MGGGPALNGLSFFGLDKSRQTPNSTVLRAGVEYLYLTSRDMVVPFRIGLSREPQPVVDRVTGEQRVMYGIALGTGLKSGSLTMDIAYRYGWANRHASQFLDVSQILSGSTSSSVGSEKTVEHRLDLSFIVQFDRKPVEKVLRHLFIGD